MNKAELVASIATSTELSKKDVQAVIDSFTATVGDVLAAGGEVGLVGFGTFSVKGRAARAGRNPKTGEALEIPASKAVKLKVGKALKEKVNA